MNTKLSILLLSALLGLAACTVDDNPADNPETPDTSAYSEPDYNAVRCDVPVFVSGSIKPEVRTALESYLTNITSLDEAEVAVVKGEDIGAYEGRLMDLYKRGGLVVVARPTGERFQAFADRYGIFDALPFDTSQPVLLFATDKTGISVTLYDSTPFDGTYPDDDGEEGAGPVTEEDEVMPAPEDETTHYRRIVFSFFRWLKQLREQRTAARTRAGVTFVSQFNPEVLITDFVSHTHIFEVKMEHKVYQIHGCSGDYLNKTGTVSVTYSVKPCYIYEPSGSDKAGDYYIVKCDVVANNGDVWAPFSKSHGWHGTLGTVMVAGYYMRELRLASTLMTTDKQSTTLDGISFALQPNPVTTINSAAYTTGIELGLNGALSVGTMGINGSVGFNAGYSSSTTVNISDLNIEKYTDEDTHSVQYKYVVQNILLDRFEAFKKAFDTMSLYDIVHSYFATRVPAIARSDFDATSWWVWKVPAGTNGVADDAKTRFCIRTNLGLTHDSYAYWNSFLSSHKSFDYNDNYATAVIPAPDRQPFGLIALRNGTTKPIGNMRIYRQGSAAAPDTIQIDGIFMTGETAISAHPVGTYAVEYNQLTSDTNKPEKSFRITGIDVKKGGNQDDSTTTITTADGQEQ